MGQVGRRGVTATGSPPTVDTVRLEGWNQVPRGAGASFETASAPGWLRVLAATPVLDRFAYPLLVRRGLGWLQVHDAAVFDEQAAARAGWRVRPADYVPPGSVSQLRGEGEPPTR